MVSGSAGLNLSQIGSRGADPVSCPAAKRHVLRRRHNLSDHDSTELLPRGMASPMEAGAVTSVSDSVWGRNSSHPREKRPWSFISKGPHPWPWWVLLLAGKAMRNRRTYRLGSGARTCAHFHDQGLLVPWGVIFWCVCVCVCRVHNPRSSPS